MLYDYNEVVEFKTGKRQEGAVSGVIIFATKVGGAISYWLSGLILAAIGYDGTATVFSASVKHGILALNTIVPAGISVVILIFIIIYPITRKNFALLRQALELKNAGKEYSTEGFERLL
jgi:Na+/melibiose symporter-like transporter